jgi:hypothetical protein
MGRGVVVDLGVLLSGGIFGFSVVGVLVPSSSVSSIGSLFEEG